MASNASRPGSFATLSLVIKYFALLCACSVQTIEDAENLKIGKKHAGGIWVGFGRILHINDSYSRIHPIKDDHLDNHGSLQGYNGS